MNREVKVGSISWINGKPNPVWTSAQAATLEPAWIPKTYLGLAATKNDPPPNSLSDFKGYQAKQDFRALTYCKFSVDLDDATGRINSFRVLDAVHDPGWTPFFKLRHWPASTMSIDTEILFGWKAYQGEASSNSLVNTQARHANSVFAKTGTDETVLVNALIKFRAGKHTDDIGVDTVECPFHVPWVWCETLLTYSPSAKKLKLYGKGSIFPSHAWYLDDSQLGTVPEASDSTFPISFTKTVALNPSLQVIPDPMWVTVPTGPTIVVSSLNVYPVLCSGAPASGPQAPLADEGKNSGPVDSHPFTVSAGKAFTSP
jgi:hypothetical protein